MKKMKTGILVILMIFSMSAIANAQSTTGDKDKKQSNTKESKTTTAPAKEVIRESPVSAPNEKSSGVPNTHEMAVPAGSQVELPKTGTPK